MAAAYPTPPGAAGSYLLEPGQARQRARELEPLISGLLIQYSERAALLQRMAGLGGQTVGSAGGGGYHHRSLSSLSPQEQASVQPAELARLHAEIQGALQELDHVLRFMQPGDRAVPRFQEFVHQAAGDVRRSRSGIEAAQARMELLGGGPGRSSSGLQPNTEKLMREKTSLLNSLAMADQALQQAQDARAGLDSQRKVFDQITGGMMGLVNRFPTIRQTIGQIKNKKHRDTVVLSCVLAVLILFTLWYTSNNS